MLRLMQTANLVLAFGLELVMLAALAVWGIVTGDTPLSRWVLGLGSPVLVAVLWGIWLAPRSDLRLELPWLVVAQVAGFALGVAALYVAGYPRPAVWFAALVALNVSLAVLWGQY